KDQPENWQTPPSVALKNYGEFWADEILPIAREAHERLQFIKVHETLDQGRKVMAGYAREKNAPDRVGYADWSAKIVREELHKAGWRLADLLQQALTTGSTNAPAPPIPAEPRSAQPTSPTPSAGFDSRRRGCEQQRVLEIAKQGGSAAPSGDGKQMRLRRLINIEQGLL